MTDTYQFTIEGPEETTDELEIPTAALDAMLEDGGEPVEAIGDFAVMLIAEQLHGVLHHSDGEVDPSLEAAESEIMDTFEDRFGVTFAEMTGHSH